MISQKKFIVSHAPFWHNGSNINERSYHMLLAALPAVLAGIYYYGIAALSVVALSVASAILWELVIDRLLALDTDDIDTEQIKWVVMMVLFSQPGQEQSYARMEDLVFAENPGWVH